MSSSKKPVRKRYLLRKPPSQTIGPAGPQGPAGPAGTISLPLSSDNVDYRGDDLTGVLDGLLYVNPLITAFAAPASPFEKGQILTSINLTWAYNKAVTSQTIPATAIVVSPTLLNTDRAKVVTLNNAASDFGITLNGDDGSNVASQTLDIKFLNKIYFGQAIVPGVMNSAFILSLPHEFATSRLKEFIVNLGVNSYAWFAYPTSMGLATFKTNGFSGGFDPPATVSFTNASGHTENYYVYRSTNSNLGITDIEVL